MLKVNNVYNVNCKEGLKQLDDNSVDSIVTDPPYELGFMNKRWDSTGITYDVEMWKECLRVLKPGGYLLSFGGSRTYHRMACAIEDAGFEIRDQIMWIYGCLSEDTEILTINGWEKGLNIKEGDLVASWNPTNEKIEFKPVLQKFVAPYDGDMIVFKNDNTDQLLTPNHRVYKKRFFRKQDNKNRKWFEEESWNTEEAGKIKRWERIKFPLSGFQEGTGIGGKDYASLLGWVWTEGGYSDKDNGVRIYQSSVNSEKVREIEELLKRLCNDYSRYERERKYKGKKYIEYIWYFNGNLAKKVKNDLPNKKPTYPLLWNMTLKEKEAFLDASLKGDGSGNRFYQKDSDDLIWFQTLLHVTGKQGRINNKKYMISIHNNPTTEFQSRHLKNDKEYYQGLVWCIQVETGAFVARRNDKIFITGNSGFPKSLDISKAIDKKLGAKRPLSETQRPIGGKNGVYEGQGGNWGETTKEPITDEAKQWNGWGTALKPAHEPIVMARKPLSEKTVADNVLKWNTGGINIDDSRIPTDWENEYPESWFKSGKGKTITWNGENYKTEMTVADRLNKNGRFPANVILDEETGKLLDGQSGITKSAKVKNVKEAYDGESNTGFIRGISTPDNQYDDSGGASRFFYCAKASKKERSEGNNHPTVKPIKLMEYLIRLVTPPNGTVLDPFAGSGTTLLAAKNLGFNYIGFEKEEEYIEIINKRLK